MHALFRKVDKKKETESPVDSLWNALRQGARGEDGKRRREGERVDGEKGRKGG